MGLESSGTFQFMRKMQPHALAVYQRIFPGCIVEDLRKESLRDEDRDGVHILDRNFAIDSLIRMPDGSFFTLQEKYRKYAHLKSFGDFTQEFMNGFGTKHQAHGEWFHLGAQLYFYGWANEEETDFEEYLLLDITKYKLLVHRAGGLEEIGTFQVNERFGRAAFYGICLGELKPAIITCKVGEKHAERIRQHMDMRARNKARREAAESNAQQNEVNG
jgi:hypothetical protein